jgi:hypothetical protein
MPHASLIENFRILAANYRSYSSTFKYSSVTTNMVHLPLLLDEEGRHKNRQGDKSGIEATTISKEEIKKHVLSIPRKKVFYPSDIAIKLGADISVVMAILKEMRQRRLNFSNCIRMP